MTPDTDQFLSRLIVQLFDVRDSADKYARAVDDLLASADPAVQRPDFVERCMNLKRGREELAQQEMAALLALWPSADQPRQ